MMDTLSKAERSKRMAKIPSKNTAPEKALRCALHKLGLRFRLHNKLLPGKPDIVLSKYQSVIMVHGCFWHFHSGCKVANIPKSNTDFWLEKFAKNVQRDREISERLQALGWTVYVVWECELNSLSRVQDTARKIYSYLRAAD